MKIEIDENESVSVWVRGVGEVIVCQAGVSLRSHRARTVEGPLPYGGFEKIASLFTARTAELPPSEATDTEDEG